MAIGDLVLIRSAQGQPGVRRIWKDEGARPFVCHDDYWQRWLALQVEPVCWQIDRAQIYQPDQSLTEKLEEAFAAWRGGDVPAQEKLQTLWAQARPYKGKA